MLTLLPYGFLLKLKLFDQESNRPSISCGFPSYDHLEIEGEVFYYVMTLEVRQWCSKHVVFDKFHKIMFDVRTLQGQTLNQPTCPSVQKVQLLPFLEENYQEWNKIQFIFDTLENTWMRWSNNHHWVRCESIDF